MNATIRRTSGPVGGEMKGYGWFLAAALYIVAMALSATVLS